MSLLGLLVGGFVAFLIPRYYVATTVLTYEGSVRRDPGDPILDKVANAETSLPNAVPEALMEMAQIGSEGDDPDREDVIRAVKERLTAQSFPVRDRGYWNIRIEFKDTDGQFAADFCNTVRNVWVEQIKTELVLKAERELDEAQRKVEQLRAARDNALQALTEFMRQHGIDGLEGEPAADKRASLVGRLAQHRAEQTRLQGEARGLRQRIRRLEGRLELVDETVPVPLTEESPLSRQLRPLIQRKLQLEYALGEAKEHHPYRMSYQLQLEAVNAQIQELGGAALAARTKPNPKYEDLEAELTEAKDALSQVEGSLDVVTETVEDLEKQVAELPRMFQELETLQNRYQDAKAKHDAAVADEVELQRIHDRARQGEPISLSSAAQTPPAPTEPNITLVAIAGALIGLAAAIGLVLLLDFLRSTFKTVEDVQYALKVPVLGTMAYIETTEDRLKLVRHRRRVSLVAASFLVVSVSLLTIYYLAPTRLPPAVLEALHTILGPGQ